MATNEIRVVNSVTGAEKGSKSERHDLIPEEALAQVAEVFGFGSQKYADHNWRKGYDWSLSYAAMRRHMRLFWGGEDDDAESGLPHMAHAAWHALALLTFQTEHPELDNRWATIKARRDAELAADAAQGPRIEDLVDVVVSCLPEGHEVLACSQGHLFVRPIVRGRKPLYCPEHSVLPQLVCAEA